MCSIEFSQNSYLNSYIMNFLLWKCMYESVNIQWISDDTVQIVQLVKHQNLLYTTKWWVVRFLARIIVCSVGNVMIVKLVGLLVPAHSSYWVFWWKPIIAWYYMLLKSQGDETTWSTGKVVEHPCMNEDYKPLPFYLYVLVVTKRFQIIYAVRDSALYSHLSFQVANFQRQVKFIG